MLTKDKCLLVANGKNNISRVGKRKTPLFVVGILLLELMRRLIVN